MGVFSWRTSDSKQSIPNCMQSYKPTFTVYMLDNTGKAWVETAYGGYGVFGGKCFFLLVAEMNGLTTRDEGCQLYYEYNKKTLYPMFVKDPKTEWKNRIPKECECQGHFY